MLSTSKIPQLRHLTIENLRSYLLLTGWKRVPHPHPRRVVFEKLFDNGDSIDLILPSRPNLSDHLLGLAEAVNIIAVAEEVSPDEVIRKIRHMDRDVFNVRLLTPAVGASNGSLSLAVAAREVSNLRKLFAFSASSEKEARSYFKQALSKGKKHAEYCQFGQTFQGSFGFSIESPLIISKQSTLEGDKKPLPFERKVIERIVRGFLTIQDALLYDDLSLVTNSYNKALNANMCQALVEMSIDKRMQIEYSVQWSPILEPSEDVRQFKSICLDSKAYDYLERAVEEMKFVEPREVTIQGQIHSLHTTSDPRVQDNAPRMIEVNWHDEELHSIKVKVSLSAEEYLAAIEAHSGHKEITVTGLLENRGSRWELENPTDFDVL